MPSRSPNSAGNDFVEHLRSSAVSTDRSDRDQSATKEPSATLRHVQSVARGELSRLRRRRSFRFGQRVFVETRALRDVDRDRLVESLRRNLGRLPGVAADTLAVGASGFLVVSLAEDEDADLNEIAEAVALSERALGVSDEPFDTPAHPADPQLLATEILNLAADLAAIGISSTVRSLGVPRLPIEVPTLVSILGSISPLRRAIRDHATLEVAFVLAHAASHVGAQRTLGLAVDAARRSVILAELLVEREAWRKHEPHLVHAIETTALPQPSERRRRVAESSFERIEHQATLSSFALAGGVLFSSGDPRQAADMALAGVPRPAHLARETFSSCLGMRLARHDTVVLARQVLRRLATVDRVVIDGDSLLGKLELGKGAVRKGKDEGLLRSIAAQLLEEPEGSRQGWDLQVIEPKAPRPSGLDLEVAGAQLRALTQKGTTHALFEVRRQVPKELPRLVQAARRVEVEALLAGSDPQLSQRFPKLETVPGGRQLARSIRRLQGEGHVVLVISNRQTTALTNADIGVALYGERHKTIGADLLFANLGSIVSIIDAIGLARRADRRAWLSGLLGSAAGLGGLATRLFQPPEAMQAANVASLLAMAIGALTAAELSMHDEQPVAMPPWHALSVEELAHEIDAALTGLSTTTARDRRPKPPRRQIPAPLRSIGEELANPLTTILGSGAAASAAMGSVLDAGLIGSALALNAIAGSVQRMRTDRSVERLSRQFAHGEMSVVRDGAEKSVRAEELVIGDLVTLESGDVVLCDCRIVSANHLEVDESAVTGESMPVAKSPGAVPSTLPLAERTCILYAGSSVVAGSAQAIVVTTGSQVAALADLDPEAKPPPTGVERRLRSLTTKTVPAVLGAGAALLGESLLRGQPTREALNAGISLSTAAVPEGLPFVATAAQTAAATRLSKHGVIVRNQNVLEALGRVDVFCFDKTGTLTEGQLALVEVADTKASAPLDRLRQSQRVVLAAALRATPRGRREGLPHPTDQAVVEGGRLAGVAEDLGVQRWRRRRSLLFEPGRGYHATLGADDSHFRLSVKGAPEVVLARCSAWREQNSTRPITERTRRRLLARLEALGQRGLRVLAVAERVVASASALRDEVVHGLEFLGFIAIGDIARPSAGSGLVGLPPGVQVMMITGDHPSTARWVAEELGLLNEGRVVSGSELDELDDQALDELVGEVGVVARATPAMKVRIIEALQRGGRVVAMTGDGANDAQAIRLADVGIAFGPRATAAARETADLVATGESLEVVLAALAEGRAMWASVREALAVLLGGNLGEAAFTLGATSITGTSPLTPRQLLAVNLFTDLAPALALAVQPASSEAAATESPETSLGAALTRGVAIRATATAAGAGLAFALASFTGTMARARTVALAALVGGQLGQTVLAGHKSALTLTSSALSAAGLVAIVETPGINAFFDCRPLGPLGWGIALIGSTTATLGAAIADRVLAPRPEADRGPAPGRRRP